MQSKQATFKQYVLAGDRLTQNERIMVSPHVFVENAGCQDGRDAFRTQKDAGAVRGISIKWALLLVSLAVVIGIFMVGSKIALTQSLEAEYAQLGERYSLAQKEQQSLQRLFDQKSDASGICYYAVQNLGMRLATHEETVGVRAAYLPRTPDRALGTANRAR